jgi:hypothetical protein
VQTESLEEEPWAEVIETALEGLEGKIRAADVWLILDIDVARRTPDADCRMGYAMRELGWTRKRWIVDSAPGGRDGRPGPRAVIVTGRERFW